MVNLFLRPMESIFFYALYFPVQFHTPLIQK